MAFWKNDDPPRPEEAARPDGGTIPPRQPVTRQFHEWMRQREEADRVAMEALLREGNVIGPASPRPEDADRPDNPRPIYSPMDDMLQSRQAPAIRAGVDLTREMMDRIEALTAEVRELREMQPTALSVSANLADISNPAVARANLGISQPDIDLWGRVTRRERHADGSESITIENENGELIHRDALPVTYFHDRCILFTLTEAQTSRMARHRDIPWQQIFDHIVESECSRAEQPSPRPSPVAGRVLQLRPHREVEADE